MLFDRDHTFVDLSLPKASQRESEFTALIYWILPEPERKALRYLVVPIFRSLDKWCHDQMYDHLFPTQACVAGNGGVGSFDDNVPPRKWYRFCASKPIEIVSSKRSRG